ncbi:MAG: XRE family transcriptional regulator [Chloroflexi bacterium]|nr:MAG: XRE family transcriptional regulator [Chloroflexota bacterium]
MSLNLVNVVFGMKVRQARTEAGLSLSEFASLCELSPSYVTEIEKGRKYPRADKIMRMAEVLGKSYDELVSIKLDASLKYLESALSSAVMRRFPFAEFGLEAGDLVTLLTREPIKISALIHAILEIGRRYDLKEEDFLRAALRSYQEIHENYFPDLEEAALAFTAEFGPKYNFTGELPVRLDVLETILQEEYHYKIDREAIVANPLLSRFRSVFVRAPQPRLYVNGKLYPRQIKFLIARELGYRYLGLEERSITSTPDRVTSFQQLLNDFKAAYFGGALLMPRANMTADLQQLFDMTTWSPLPFKQLLAKYDVTPEMLLYRFSELVPEFFGLRLHFLRFHHVNDTFHLIKHLNMNQLLVPSGIGLHEHHCRRWLSVRLLQEIANQPIEETHVGVQISEFLESQERFLCLGFARPLVLSPNVNSSVIVGFRVTPDLKQVVRFLDDPAIPHVIIHETCERCPLTEAQCQVRAAEPTQLREAQIDRERRLAINELGA